MKSIHIHASQLKLFRFLGGCRFSNFVDYANLEEVYNSRPDKKVFHFHRNFAEGDVQMPRVITPFTIDMLRYLLTNEMKENYKGMLILGEAGSPDEKKYADAPILWNGIMLKIARNSAFATNESGDNMWLNSAEFDTFTPSEGEAQRLYAFAMAKFEEKYSDSNYAALINCLIDGIVRIEGDFFAAHYNAALRGLKNRLTDNWRQAKQNNIAAEMKEITRLLDVLENELNSVAKFLK